MTHSTVLFIILLLVTAALITWWLTRRPKFWCSMRGGYCEKHGQCATSTDCWAGKR